MKVWLFIIGLLLVFFGVYPPFHTITFTIGIILAIVGLLIKNKEKK